MDVLSAAGEEVVVTGGTAGDMTVFINIAFLRARVSCYTDTLEFNDMPKVLNLFRFLDKKDFKDKINKNLNA